MDIFIAWNADDLEREIELASRSDNADRLRRISQSTERGNLVWKSWVEAAGGSVIGGSANGGRATIPASRLGELDSIREQYSTAVESAVTVGVGMKLSEADKALTAAKLQGGDRVVLYNPEVDSILGQKDAAPKSAIDQLASEHLNKAVGASTPAIEAPAKLAGAHAGMSGASRPSMPTVDKPVVEASEHTQGEAMHSLMENENPNPPEVTHAEQDLEELFHALAAEGHSQDARDAAQKAHANASAQRPDALDDIRQKVGAVLQMVKGQSQTIEQMKDAAPDVYQSFMGLIQVMIEMAHQLTVTGPQNPGSPAAEESSETKKSEDTLEKNRPTPKFPKLGLPDDRRETPIVNDSLSLETKGRAIANSAMVGELYHEEHPNKKPILAHGQVSDEQLWDAWSDNTQGVRDGYRRAAIGQGKNNNNGAASVTGPAKVSYAKGNALRDPMTVQQLGERGPDATKLHEDWHMMMGRIQDKYGMLGRKNVVTNMLKELHRRDTTASETLEQFSGVRNRNLPKTHSMYGEETVASLMNYVNNPTERESFHRFVGHSDEEARAFSTGMKRAHKHLTDMARSDVIDTWAMNPEHLMPESKLPKKSLIPGRIQKSDTWKPPAIAPIQPHEFKAPAKAPQLHNTVEGFLTAFKALPKGTADRGKFITSHMNHGPFLSALKAHPQGQQVHQMLTTHLNSKANAGIKPGATQTIVKAEGQVKPKSPKAKAAAKPRMPKATKQPAPAKFTPPQPKPHPTDTPEFKNWFGPSHVVEADGSPMRVFHGTTHDFTEFSHHKGNPENWYGRAHYFTDSYEDVGSNYASDSGPDLQNRIANETERIYQDQENEDWDGAKAKAKVGLVGPAPRTIPAYLRIHNPVKVQRFGGTQFELEPTFDEDGENLSGEFTGSGTKIIDALHRTAQQYLHHYGAPDGHELVGHILENTRLFDGHISNAWEIEEALRSHDRLSEMADDNGVSVSNEFIRDFWRNAGHDGIIMDASRFHNMPGVHGTNHYIVFDPTQIKSAVGNNGQFDPQNPDFGKDELDPSNMEKGAPTGVPHSTRHHLVLPVGTHKEGEGKIKVTHGDGKEGWIQARAGQIMSADGHPISSRNAGGK